MAETITLIHFRVIKSTAELHNLELVGDGGRITLFIEGSNTDPEFKDGMASIVNTIRFDLDALHGEKNKETEPVFSTSITLTGQFILSEEDGRRYIEDPSFQKEISSSFANRLFPLARTYCAELLHKMDLPSLDLPWRLEEESDPH